MEGPGLDRKLTFPLLVLYGLGTTIGAGIYALLGTVVGTAGLFAPAAFLLAAGLASLTALSFCELSARLPHAGGEAVYVGEGLRSRTAARVVGIAISAAACLSAATVGRGFVGYVSALLPLPEAVWIVLLMVALGGVAAWGIGESARLAAALTLLEAGGLCVVVAVCHEGLATLPARLDELVPPLDFELWVGIGSTSLICFYAFLGFEDMVNVAEEVHDVRRVLPRAILTVLGITVVLYLLVTVAAVLTMPPEVLGASQAPLVDLVRHATGGSGTAIRVVGVLAMLNGVLVQLIKASRILYGLGMRAELPGWLARVHPVRRTPVRATSLVVAIAVLCAVALPIDALARLTSGVTLAVFALANLALWKIQRRDPRPEGVPRVPAWVPVAGCLVSTALLAFELARQVAGV